MGFLFKRSFEALAEIFDFAAPRAFPKKERSMKSDLQNLTASLVKKDLKEKVFGWVISRIFICFFNIFKIICQDCSSEVIPVRLQSLTALSLRVTLVGKDCL